MASNSTLEQVIAEYITTTSVIVEPAITSMLLYLVYGVYTVVFGLSIHVFTKRHDNPPGSPSTLSMGNDISLYFGYNLCGTSWHGVNPPTNNLLWSIENKES